MFDVLHFILKLIVVQLMQQMFKDQQRLKPFVGHSESTYVNVKIIGGWSLKQGFYRLYKIIQNYISNAIHVYIYQHI